MLKIKFHVNDPITYKGKDGRILELKADKAKITQPHIHKFKTDWVEQKDLVLHFKI